MPNKKCCCGTSCFELYTGKVAPEQFQLTVPAATWVTGPSTSIACTTPQCQVRTGIHLLDRVSIDPNDPNFCNDTIGTDISTAEGCLWVGAEFDVCTIVQSGVTGLCSGVWIARSTRTSDGFGGYHHDMFAQFTIGDTNCCNWTTPSFFYRWRYGGTVGTTHLPAPIDPNDPISLAYQTSSGMSTICTLDTTQVLTLELPP